MRRSLIQCRHKDRENVRMEVLIRVQPYLESKLADMQ